VRFGGRRRQRALPDTQVSRIGAEPLTNGAASLDALRRVWEDGAVEIESRQLVSIDRQTVLT
jgi:hypothetical protein